MTEAEAKDIAEKAKLRVATHVSKDKKEGKTSGPTQARLKALAKQPDEIKKAELEIKKKKEEIKQLPKSEKTVPTAELKRDEAKLKLMKAEKKLKEAQDKKNEKAIEKAKKAVEKAKQEVEKKQAKLKEIQKKQKMDLKHTAERDKKVQEQLDKAGVKKKEDPTKDDKAKGTENEQTKSEQKAKLAGKINVDGMNIQQHADKYVLVAKNGREIDVTDVMNQIDKYNKGVDAQNAAAKAEGEVKSGIDGKAKDMNAKDAGLPTNGANGNVIVKGVPEAVPSIPAPQQQAAEDLVGKNMPNLDKDEKALVAQTALELSKTDLLKDPKGLEKLNDRKKENDEKERQREQIKLRQQQNVGR